jgi:hypothetical protein
VPLSLPASFWVAIVLGGYCLGGNCSGWQLSGWQLSRVAFVLGDNCPRWQLSRVAIVLGGNCPRWQLSGWQLSGWQLPRWQLARLAIVLGGNCSGGNCPNLAQKMPMSQTVLDFKGKPFQIPTTNNRCNLPYSSIVFDNVRFTF